MRRVAAFGAVLLCPTAAYAATVYEVYRVQPGDTAESIAERHDITVGDLRDLNPHLLTGTLTPNELLTVPLHDSPAVAAGRDGQGPSRMLPNGVNKAGTICGAVGGPRLYGPDGQPIVSTPDQIAPLRSTAGGQEQETGSNAAGSLPESPQQPVTRPDGSLPMIQPPRSGPLRKTFVGNGSVGRLGFVTSNRTPLLRERRADATVLYAADCGTKLVVIQQHDDWYAVMMADRSTGWVEAQFVRLTATELVSGGAVQGSAVGRTVIQEAYRYLGVPYRWGGNGASGIDCSGLVQQCYRTQGVVLPRVSREQYGVGTAVPWNELQAGDRVYFASDGQRIDHTGLYIGNGQFIHASGRRRMVCIDNLFNPRYWSIFVGAKR